MYVFKIINRVDILYILGLQNVLIKTLFAVPINILNVVFVRSPDFKFELIHLHLLKVHIKM